MKRIRILCMCLFLFSFTSSVFGQEVEKGSSFTLSGQLRTRFEYRDGAFRPLSVREDPAVLILSRVRLNMDYTYSDLLEMKLSFQNVNLWGQAAPMQITDKGENGISPFEAWAALKVYRNLNIKVGRQTISLDDGRLFSDANWTNSGRTHDALAFLFQKSKFTGKAWLAFNQNYEVLYGNNINNPAGNLFNIKDAQPYKTMQTVWARYKTNEQTYISFLFSNIGFQNAESEEASHKVSFLQTTGFFYTFNYLAVFGTISGYYQMGKSLINKKSSAFLLAARIGTHVNDDMSVSIGTDYVSGNSPGVASGRNKAFQHLYGTGHKFYGSMDYFYAGNPFGDGGLIDNRIDFHYTVNPKIKIGMAGHYFLSPAKIHINNESFNKNLGQEVDAQLSLRLNKFADLEAGYSAFFTTKNLLALKNVSSARSLPGWGWFSLNINPEFFRIKF